MLRAEGHGLGAPRGDVDQRGDGREDLGDGGEEREEEDAPYLFARVGYWGLREPCVVR